VSSPYFLESRQHSGLVFVFLNTEFLKDLAILRFCQGKVAKRQHGGWRETVVSQMSVYPGLDLAFTNPENGVAMA
jgi:hypothetical protein